MIIRYNEEDAMPHRTSGSSLSGDAMETPLTTRRRAHERGLLCDPDAPDAVLLRAVVEHYVAARRSSKAAARWLADHGIDDELAEVLCLGFADRTLGVALPEPNRLAGRTLRARLSSFGVLRATGHEHFRGCVVVPIFESDEVVGLCGIPIAGGEPRFAAGLPGGVFRVAVGAGEPVVCESIPRALELAAIGTPVIAPGYPDGAPTELLATEAVMSAITKSSSVQTADEAGQVELVGPGEARVQFSERAWRVRGASRDKGYGSLRVNLSVTDLSTGALHLDALDLYSARARALFIRTGAHELRSDPVVVGRELGRALFAAERAAELTEVVIDEPSPMSETERAEAMALLTDTHLVERITADVASLGVVGEEDNALVLYLAATSRLARRPLGVVVQSSSAAGKSTLAEAVLSLMPESDTVSLSALSAQALYYLDTDALAHKVLFVAEEEGATRASYALKLLQSDGKLSIATAGKDARTGRITTTTSVVHGPVSLVMTTTRVDLDEELANRLIALSVNESVEQTRAVLEQQRLALSIEGMNTTAKREKVIALHNHAQALLEPLAVVVPDPSRLHFSESTTRARRDHAKYLSLICASALLHQFQRPRHSHIVNGETVEYVDATENDLALADRLAVGVLMRDTTELPPGTEALLGALSAWTGTDAFTRRQAREALTLGDTQLKVHLRRLVDLEYVTATRRRGTVCYQLCWSAPETSLRSTTTTSERSGLGRGEVGTRSVGGRGASNRGRAQLNREERSLRDGAKHARGSAGVRDIDVGDLVDDVDALDNDDEEVEW
jgi:hypothetical protein